MLDPVTPVVEVLARQRIKTTQPSPQNAAGHARDVRLLLAALLLGMVLDSTLAASGLLANAAATSTSFAPIWILALWAGFALTLKHSMAWFAHRPYAAATFGLLGGPMAYAGAGAVAGAVSFPLVGCSAITLN